MPQSAHATARVLAAKSKRMVRKIRDYHRKGRQAGRDPNVAPTEWMIRWGVSDSTARKIRAFASRYTPEDLQELCRLRRANGLPFHWGYVSCFLAVANRDRRRDLQRRAAQENWSVPTLQTHVVNWRRPIPLRGGRPLRKTSNRLDALHGICRDLHAANRRLEQALAEWSELDADNQRQVREMFTVLVEQLSEAESSLQDLRRRRR